MFQYSITPEGRKFAVMIFTRDIFGQHRTNIAVLHGISNKNVAENVDRDFLIRVGQDQTFLGR